MQIVSATNRKDFNSPPNRNEIIIRDSEEAIVGNRFSINVVPNSATAIVFDVK